MWILLKKIAVLLIASYYLVMSFQWGLSVAFRPVLWWRRQPLCVLREVFPAWRSVWIYVDIESHICETGGCLVRGCDRRADPAAFCFHSYLESLSCWDRSVLGNHSLCECVYGQKGEKMLSVCSVSSSCWVLPVHIYSLRTFFSCLKILWFLLFLYTAGLLQL